MPSAKERLGNSVTVAMMKKGSFKSEAVLKAVDDFFDFGFDPTYFALTSEARIAEHVYGYMCALVSPPDATGASGFAFAMEAKDYAFYFTRSTDAAVRRTESRVEEYLARHFADATRGLSVRTYTSRPGAIDSDRVILYAVERPPFRAESLKKVPKAEWSVKSLATPRFHKLRTSVSLARYEALFDKLKNSFVPVAYTVTPLDGERLALQIGFLPDRSSYFEMLTVLLSSLGPQVTVTKKFLEKFANGVQVYSFYFSGATAEALQRIGDAVAQMPNRGNLAPVMEMFLNKTITSEETSYATALIMFAFYFTPPTSTDDFRGLMNALQNDAASTRKVRSLRNDMFRELMSEEYICTVLVRNVNVFRALYNDFASGTTEQTAAQLRVLISSSIATKTERDVFLTFVKFNVAVKRTNFFRPGASAIAYRLDPSFIAELEYPRVPYAIFLVVGAHFRGFHVRFADIARGGIRMIVSRGETKEDVNRAYRRNKTFLFNENYNLAHTQMLKNKDIPESGSKGTILVSTRAVNVDAVALYLQYVDALLDLMLPNVPGVRDTLGKEEILFLGPDEGTAGVFPSIAAKHAKSRGYAHWKSFTTGKTSDLGGIPHDTYGMTTRSVRTYATNLYKTLGLDETKLTKFMTGGPDGDLGSNEVLMGREKVVAICDGFASVHDPEGISHDELVRLAKARKSLKFFDASKLGPRGFHVGVTDRNKQLPDGSVVADGTQFRNEFHFSPYADADVMVPCGGRPASVDLRTVHRMLRGVANASADSMLARKQSLPASNLRFKMIVEGANLFITQDARLALENCGVHLFKDSSTNKGGVTSSSLEVLAGLALKDTEHAEMMCVPPGKEPPAFYETQVREICSRVEGNAKREYDCIMREAKLGCKGGCKTLISDELSKKINTIKTFVQHSNLHEDTKLFRYVIYKYLLPSTLKQVPLDEVMQRVPRAYLVAIFAIYIASNFVYDYGIENSNEFSFFQFMHKLHGEATAMGSSKL